MSKTRKAPAEGSRPGCALPHIKKWCEVQIAPRFPDPRGNLRFRIPGNFFTRDELMWAVSDVFLVAGSHASWTARGGLHEDKLFEVAPALSDWKEREEHMPTLCAFLSGIAEQVYVDWEAAKITAELAKRVREEAAASAELTPAELRKRVAGLDRTIELMHETFLDYKKHFETATLSSSESDGANDLVARFEMLMSCATSPRGTPIDRLNERGLLPETGITFLTAPSEIRNRVYAILAADMFPMRPGGRDRTCIDTYASAQEDHPKLLVFSLAQVNKQIRSEFLAIWHRILELLFDYDSSISPNLTSRWLKLFGPSRVPLTRSFRFSFGRYDSIRVELQRAPPPFRASDFPDQFGAAPAATLKDGGSAQKEQVKISSPAAWSTNVNKVRQKKEAGFESRLQTETKLLNFVKSVVVESEGTVHLTADGVLKVMNYLKWRYG